MRAACSLAAPRATCSVRAKTPQPRPPPIRLNSCRCFGIPKLVLKTTQVRVTFHSSGSDEEGGASEFTGWSSWGYRVTLRAGVSEQKAAELEKESRAPHDVVMEALRRTANNAPKALEMLSTEGQRQKLEKALHAQASTGGITGMFSSLDGSVQINLQTFEVFFLASRLQPVPDTVKKKSAGVSARLRALPHPPPPHPLPPFPGAAAPRLSRRVHSETTS